MWIWCEGKALVLSITLIVVTKSDIFDDTCGKVFQDFISTRTVGGTKASIAPWTVSIGRQSLPKCKIFRVILILEFHMEMWLSFEGYLRKTDDKFIHQCTGVIIGASIIVTAAHCSKPPAGREK